MKDARSHFDGSALKIVSILVLSLNLARMLASLVEALFLVCYQEPILGSCRYTVFTDAKNMDPKKVLFALKEKD